MKRALASLALTFLVGGSVVVGCSGDPNTNPTGGGTTEPIAFENLSLELAKIYCDLAFSCCTSMEQTEIFKDLSPVPTNVAECTTSFKGMYDMYVFGNIKASIDAGRLKYDGALAAACLAKVNDQCSALEGGGLNDTDENCSAVFVGLVADGGDCTSSQDCATKDAACPIPQGATLGQCSPPAKEGEACPDFNCVTGLVCGSVNMMDVCMKPLADGQACSSSFDCVSEYCDFATQKCAQLKAIGEACADSYECKDGYCESQSMVCTALKADGEACMGFDECKSYDCAMDTMKCVSEAPKCDGI